MFSLVHVTDPHFRGFSGATFADLFGKRLAGGVNLLLFRRRKHRMELLQALGRDLGSRGFDHLAITGDLTNIALPGELAAAQRWIAALARPGRDVTVIPGNHDVYVPSVVESGQFETAMSPYQTADLPTDPAGYPFVRLRGDVALVAINTCVPTGDLGAWGEIGAAQLTRIHACLVHPDVARRLRVVLMHHPPVMHRGAETRNLRDRAAFAAILSEVGADLVLHGHDHRDEAATLPGPAGHMIPVVGAGSASYEGGPASRASFNVYELHDRQIVLRIFRHNVATDAFDEVAQRSLTHS